MSPRCRPFAVALLLAGLLVLDACGRVQPTGPAGQPTASSVNPVTGARAGSNAGGGGGSGSGAGGAGSGASR